MDAGNSKSNGDFNMKLFENKRLKLQAMQQSSKLNQQQGPSQSGMNRTPVSNNEILNEKPKKLSTEDVIAKGRIIKIVEKTLTANEFKVQCEYEQQIIELIATKQDIVKNNIIPLLDYYENTLGLR